MTMLDVATYMVIGMVISFCLIALFIIAEAIEEWKEERDIKRYSERSRARLEQRRVEGEQKKS